MRGAQDTGTITFFQTPKERDVRLLPREGNLYVIDVPVAAKPGPWWELAWGVWLDPARNFMPTKWTEWIVKSGRPLHNSDCTIELAEVAPGVWAPISANYSVYHKTVDMPIFGKKMGANHLKVDMAKSWFNIEVPEDRFVMKIPDGATVSDRIRNVVYTQGASDPDAYLAGLAKQGREAVTGLPKGGPSIGNQIFVPDQPSFWSRGRVVAFGATVLIVGILAALASRRSRGRVA